MPFVSLAEIHYNVNMPPAGSALNCPECKELADMKKVLHND